MRAWERGGVFDVEVIDERSGFIQFSVTGKNALRTFDNEGGGHRWQRIPPTEKRGRVQTSTVTVAVMKMNDVRSSINFDDVEITTSRGSGPGGQHKNKTDSCVTVVHKPTGLSVRIDNDRSQHRNKSTALAVLEAKVNELQESRLKNEQETSRKSQVGSGMRGDKVRTYRAQDDVVTDHRTGQRWKLRDWMRGNW